ncbi:MAG: glycosyltransferase [Acidobacteriota bacterium]
MTITVAAPVSVNCVSLVVPAFNEEDGIGPVVERMLAVRQELQERGWQLEILVVDDGSRDRTAEVVAGYPEVRLVRHPINRGYGAAIKTGFRHAQGDYLAFIDADGTYPPESLPDLCRAASEQKADLVIGSRMSGAHTQMPLTRRVGNLAYAALLSIIGNTAVRDTTSGMRLLRRSVLAQLYPLSDGLDFTPAMSTRAIHENLKIVEVPIPYAERLGRSKLNVLRDGFRFTNSIVWTALTYNPVRILGLLGIGAIGVALLIALVIVAMRLSGVTTLGPVGVFGIFTALVLGVSGVSAFSLGAMFNYLVSLFDKRPVRRGLFGKPIFDPSLDHHFGWMGLVGIFVGTLLGLVSFILGMNGWEATRLWFYLLTSVSFILIGLQLTISWIVMRILEELTNREVSTQRDIGDNLV